MSFIGELIERVDANVYNAINFGGRYCYVEGVIRVTSIGDEEIKFAVKGAILTVSGENLMIEELDEGTVIVKGDIGGINATKTE